MNRRNEAIRLLKEAKTIRKSVPGSRLPLTSPRLTEWSSYDDRWLSIVALYYVAEHCNNNEGEPGYAAQTALPEIMKRVQHNYLIDDTEL